VKNFAGMKQVLGIVLFGLLQVRGISQLKDSVLLKADSVKINGLKSEILSGGFIDIAQNGQMNASARLFRLYIGEPGKWQLPVSLYSGVTADNFSMDRGDEELCLQLINPGAGIFNLSIDGNNCLIGAGRKFTSFRLQYQAGFRFLSVFNSVQYRNFIFYNLVSGLGLMIATGAWEKGKTGNMGICWLSFRALYSGSPPLSLKEFIEEKIKTDMIGYSIGLGIDISQALNIRAFYFRYISNRNIEMFLKPLLQLSFNYSLKE
jgi:hypothetical protein